jgi:hypothetical protein
MTMGSDTWNGEAEQIWRSGPWSLTLRGDELADIRFDGALILRALRFIARDRDWRTPRAVVEDVQTTDTTVVLHSRCRLDEIDISAVLDLRIEGNNLTLTSTATAQSAFWTQRIGLVAQQPPTLAGTPLTVTHPDGTATDTTFPETVKPHQPAVDIEGLSWTVNGAAVHAAFSGDVFEIEDQRNWTDASYKAYTPPLDRPAPILTNNGDTWTHGITVTVTPTGAPTPDRNRDDVEHVTLIDTGRAVPSIGIGASTAPDHGGPRTPAPADFVLVELNVDGPNWPAALERAATSGLPLDVRIVTDHPTRVRTVVAALRQHPVVRVGVFASSTHVTERALWAALRATTRDLDAELVGGARSHFTELNRTHDRLPAFDSYTFSLSPQMHVHETAQITESLGMQNLVTRDALAIAKGRAVHVGPVTLRPRLNAVATTPPSPERSDLQDGYGPEHVPGATDPRQSDREVAAWTIASAAALAAAGASTLTYFEEWGPRGVETSDGNASPARAALAALTQLAGSRLLIPSNSHDTEGLLAIGGRTRAESTALVSNLSAKIRRVSLHVDELGATLTLPPYSWAEVKL